MGSSISTAVADVISTVLKPFTDFLTRKCEDKCGAWDAGCYLQNACMGSLIRLFTSLTLLVIMSVFAYLLLWKTGIIKCLVKCTCKLSWKACRGSCRALGGACGSLCHRLANTRRRHDTAAWDVEMGDRSWSGSASDWSESGRAWRRSPSFSRERRMERMRRSLHARRQISKVEHGYAARRSHAYGDRGLHDHHAYSSVRVRHGSPRHDRAIVLHAHHR